MANMATDPNLLGIRETLKNKYNVADERIGYDGEYVTIDGQKSIKPLKNVEGTTYADQATFNSAAGGINNLNNQYNLMQQVLGGAGAGGQQAQPNPLDQQFTELLNTLSGRLTNPTPVTMQQVLASPEYAAQQAQIQRQAGQGIRTAQESLGDAGFARSTRLTDRAQRIQNDANEYLTTVATPQIMQQMRGEQDRQVAALMDLLGVLGSERSFQDSRSQNQFSRAMELLGYQTDRTDRAEDVNYRNSRDQVSDQQYAEEVAYREARDAITDERWKKEFDEDVRRYGLDYAMQQAVRQDRLSAEKADRALRSRGLDLEERSLDIREKESGSQGNVDFQNERRGLADAIRTGEVTPGQALQQIEEDLKLGFYTSEQAALLKQDLQTLSSNAPSPSQSRDQEKATEDYMANIPNDKDIDAEARSKGYPTLDYRTYYKDPKGKLAGLTFDQWKSLYGPKLSAG